MTTLRDELTTREKLLWMYEMMCRARRFDERLLPIVTGFYHSGIGQEAVGVGVCACLRQDDYLLYDHRGCTQIIAKGLSLDRIYGDFLGKVTGTCGGKGAGIVHIAAPELGILGQSGTLGGCFPIGFGAAFSARYRQSGQVVVCFFGDGASNRGTFHEALNWAAVEKLPLVLVCENNGYGVSVSVEAACAGRLCDRGLGFGVPGERVDGQDVVAVAHLAAKAVDYARTGRGPFLIEALTYRYRGHYEGDDTSYRKAEELARWKQRDPLPVHAARLVEEGHASEGELQSIRERIDQEVDAAITLAQQAPLPDPSVIHADLYA